MNRGVRFKVERKDKGEETNLWYVRRILASTVEALCENGRCRHKIEPAGPLNLRICRTGWPVCVGEAFEDGGEREKQQMRGRDEQQEMNLFDLIIIKASEDEAQGQMDPMNLRIGRGCWPKR